MLALLEKTSVFLQTGYQYTLQGEKEDSFMRFAIIAGADKSLMEMSRDETNLIPTQHPGRPSRLTTLSM